MIDTWYSELTTIGQTSNTVGTLQNFKYIFLKKFVWVRKDIKYGNRNSAFRKRRVHLKVQFIWVQPPPQKKEKNQTYIIIICLGPTLILPMKYFIAYLHLLGQLINCENEKKGDNPPLNCENSQFIYFPRMNPSPSYFFWEDWPEQFPGWGWDDLPLARPPCWCHTPPRWAVTSGLPAGLQPHPWTWTIPPGGHCHSCSPRPGTEVVFQSVAMDLRELCIGDTDCCHLVLHWVWPMTMYYCLWSSRQWWW